MKKNLPKAPRGRRGMSIVIPALNEEEAVGKVVKNIHRVMRATRIKYEVIVIDDGSDDKTGNSAQSAGARVISHPENLGYGASLKRGITEARYDIIGITDGDGSYPADVFPLMYSFMDRYDMVVGAREGRAFRGTLIKFLARRIFTFLCEFATGRSIPDINSGLRVFRKELALEHFPRLSLGFSFTTTITLAFFLTGKFIKYVPIDYSVREGRSKVRHFRDTLRAAQIIVETILLYNPVKIFILVFFFLVFASVLCAVAGVVFMNPYLAVIAAVGIMSSLVILSMGFLSSVIRGALQSLGK